jgi:hypothetical protein
VSELAAGTIRAVELLVEPFAELGLIVLGHVRLGVQFMKSVGEGAAIFEYTGTRELPVFAQLCLVFSSETFERDRALS